MAVLNQPTSVRKLAAILSADIAGYSALMGADEEGTVRKLREVREAVLPLIEKFGGRIIDLAGDGILAEFPSAVRAVESAAAVQRCMAELNAEREPAMLFRIGVNAGDVIHEGERLYGDGINVAARLQAIAEPGCICISNKVHEEVRDRVTLAFTDMGDQQLKNIARPVRAFSTSAHESTSESKEGYPNTSPLVSDKPSIAVLAFANISGDPEQDYFADGMAEDLITSLSHIRWLMVIARNSSFWYKERRTDARQIGRELQVRYLVQGSVRKVGDLVRISAQLVEAETGTHLWAEKFDGALTEIFNLQDEITGSIIGAIEPSLRGAEIERAGRKRPENLNAYDLYLRALPHAYAYTSEGRTLAIELLQQALAINSSYVEAHGLAAWCHIQRIWAETAQLSDDLASAHAHAKAVMSIGSDDAATLAFAANPYARATRDYETAIQMIEHALSQNPSSAHAQTVGAMINCWAGHYEKAISLAERSLRFSPFDPVRYLAFAALARARLFQGDPDAALLAARRALQANPRHLPSHGYAIISVVRLGRVEDIRNAVGRLLESVPNVRLANFSSHPTFEPFAAELNAAGLPE